MENYKFCNAPNIYLYISINGVFVEKHNELDGMKNKCQ